MRVDILGPLRVVRDGAPVEVTGARLRALLIRLALAPGRPVGLDLLADAVWGGAPPPEATNALQALVSRLRRALGGGAVAAVPGGYRLAVEAADVDAFRFESAVEEGRKALQDNDFAGASRLLADASGLWRGPALADVAASGWASGHVARYEELRLSAWEDRVEADLRIRAPVELIAELRAAVASHPLRERPNALLMRALHADGRQAEALAAYADCRRRLADELGVDPSVELREAYLTILRTAPEQRRRTGNLRAALTTFHGREEELRRIAELVRAQRLSTLVGPGGAGKTRLASTVGAALAERMPGGVWLAELAPVTDPDDVGPAVLRALGTRESAPGSRPEPLPDLTERLATALSAGPTLLILDNCEHVLDAVARLAEDLLGRCPELRVLTTTREPLGVFGETLCPVGPLPLPTAVRLFADRAAAVRPGFVVSDADAPAVAEICRRLDGLPLAVELAAARLRSLTVEQVAHRLGDRFRLLTGGSRTALPRHRTLRAVVDWSWDLLDDAERHLMERLSVFAGVITASAARGVSTSDAPDLLLALTDKSLLQVVSTEDTEPRYRMLETIREYALERLTGDDARVAHARYFLAAAEEARDHLLGAEQVEWIARLTDDQDNFLAALAFACDTGDADTAVRLAAALCQFWTIVGGGEEAAGWLARARDVPGDAPPDARLLVHAMHLINSAMSNDFRLMLAEIEDMLPRIRELDIVERHPFLVLVEPAMVLFSGDLDAGLAAVDRALHHPHPWARAMAVSMRGHMHENAGHHAEMVADLTEAIRLFRTVGERWGLSTAMVTLADAHLKAGRSAEAAALVEESIALTRELDPRADVPYQEVWLASLWAATGETERAKAWLTEFARTRKAPADARNASFALLALGDIARCAGDLDTAAVHYARAWSYQESGRQAASQFRALIRTSMALLALERGDLDAATEEVRTALDLSRASNDMPVVAKAAVASAALAWARGDRARAALILGASEGIRGTRDLSDATAVRLSTACAADRTLAAAVARGSALPRPEALSIIDPA
ncbi:SARP family transcriptional regulator [Virgisporangium aliadipatigenens]|uniref:SARP family transcriptional regulator n=1 Tax=Virgisporangium aliadipatigenens TaxID=741659 RepID=A0A8J3YJ64_9ACTN|nr:BTAD domain-containing putative transcriptional regulator [Virgisporangium aliadipatigenens]GIJ44901.1 SARP family transcriptional regulator [Virgisporangium aliadipatigenens]